MVKSQEIPNYLHSSKNFIDHRLKYYQSNQSISLDEVSKKLFPPRINAKEAVRRSSAIESFKNNPSIVVLTATKDRLANIRKAYQSLISQQSTRDWQWLIVDNGSADNTVEYAESLHDHRVHVVVYTEKTGCAYPARNFGLDLLHFGFWRKSGKVPQILVVDSDDYLHDEFSLHELEKLHDSCTAAESQDPILFHGFAVCEYTNENGEVTYGSHPHDISSSFPQIATLTEVFDKGLNILAGMFPVTVLDWLRYPEEFSFEDNGFNHKLLLQALRTRRKWITDQYPIVTKTFHNESMASRNDKVGDADVVTVIGEHTVVGVRSLIVSHLAVLRDYFHENTL